MSHFIVVSEWNNCKQELTSNRSQMLKDRVKNWMKKQSNSLFHAFCTIFHLNGRNTIIYMV